MVRGESHRPALCDPHSAHTAPERNASRRYFRARKWPNFSVERTASKTTGMLMQHETSTEASVVDYNRRL